MAKATHIHVHVRDKGTASPPPVRVILDPARSGEYKLIKEPDDSSPERETVEAHNRERFANHFKYADLYAGNARTYDPQGDYNCGRCNQANGTKCLLVDLKAISRSAGSCGDWENICAGDAEMRLELKSSASANYGVAANGKGFGCHRCPYASRAIRPDSVGRELYCGKGDFRVMATACCAINGAPTV